MSGSDPTPDSQPLDPIWTLALSRVVSESFDLERPEEEVVRTLVERLAAQLPGRVVVLLTGHPGSLQLSAAEVSGDWAGSGPVRLGLTPPEATAAALDESAFETVSAPGPLGLGCVTSARAPLTGPEITGLLALERETVASAAETESDLQLARLLAAVISASLSAHRRQAALQRRQELTTEAVDQVDALLLVVDESVRVRLFNRALEQLTGFTASEMQGVLLEEWLGHGEGSGLAQVVKDALAGRPTRGFEARLPLKTGGRVLVVVTTTPVVDVDHKVLGVGVVGLVRRQLAELSAQFESRAARRAQMIADIARKLDDGVGELRGLGLEAVEPVAAGLARLATGLGLLTRTVAEPLSPLSLNQVIEEALGEAADELAAARARVRTAFAGELPDLLAAKTRLRLAVGHLLHNACLALPPEGGRLTVRTWDNRDGTIGLSIADDGEGIADAALPQIFKPFYSGWAQARLGLGLAVVQDAVELHDGSIDVDSDEGEGTVVTVTLPVRSAHDPEDDPP